MSEGKKTSSNNTKKSSSKRTSDSCKVTPRGATKPGTGPGNKYSDHKK